MLDVIVFLPLVGSKKVALFGVKNGTFYPKKRVFLPQKDPLFHHLPKDEKQKPKDEKRFTKA